MLKTFILFAIPFSTFAYGMFILIFYNFMIFFNFVRKLYKISIETTRLKSTRLVYFLVEILSNLYYMYVRCYPQFTSCLNTQYL